MKKPLKILTDWVTPDGWVVMRGPTPLQKKRREAGRLGGAAVREKYGVEYYRRISRIAHQRGTTSR